MLWIMVGFMVLILLALLRAIIGPTVINRFIAINAISSMVSMVILLLAFYREEYGFIDVALVFMLCGFAGGLWIIKVLTPSVWEFKMPRLKELHSDREGVSSND